jgi:hypothetical protein
MIMKRYIKCKICGREAIALSAMQRLCGSPGCYTKNQAVQGLTRYRKTLKIRSAREKALQQFLAMKAQTIE